MKLTVLSSILTALGCFQFVSAQVTLGSEVDVANGEGNLRPRIEMTNSAPIVMWGENQGNTGLVHTARFNGTTFDPSVQINPNGTDAFTSWWAGPDISANGDEVFVIFDRQPEDSESIYVVKSSNGGISYGDTVHVSAPADLSRFSAVAVDASGNPIVTFMGHDAGWANPEYVTRRSLDGGLTYEPEVAASAVSGTEVCDCCPPNIIANGNDRLLIFRNNDSNLRDMWIAYSDDNGASFSQGQDIDLANWTIGACPSSGADALFLQDSIVVTWMTGGSGLTRVRYAALDKATLTLAYNKEVQPTSSTTIIQNFPRIAGDDLVIGVVYQQTTGGNNDIHFAWSTTGISGLADTSIIINSSTSGAQRVPDIAYAGNGIFHIVWQDDPSGNAKMRTITVSPAGLAELDVNTFTISPNPVQEVIVIPNDITPSATRILSIEGRIVWSGKSQRTISTETLPKGNYILQIRDNDGQWHVTRFVK